MKRCIVILVAGVLALAVPAYATIINVPGDQPTIQAGIDASSDDDTVRVAEGTYVENIDFSGKNIVVGSWFLDDSDLSYISSTIIDGGASGPVVTFVNGEDNTAIITGFTIQNGLASHGGGIYCDHSSPTISNNTISGNSATLYGGGIWCSASSLTINYNTISGNSAHDGGGIYCHYYNPLISHNTISGNTAGYGGGILCDHSSPTITNNTISGNSANRGGGIWCQYSDPTISNNTISGNSATQRGGGIACYDSRPPITNTIFWGDSAPNAPEIYLEGTSSPVITYCDVEGGWEGDGNIDIDPLFRDSENEDFRLMSTSCGDASNSPCIDAGDPSICDLILDCDHGLGEIRSDMGAYGGGIPCDEIPTLSEWGMLVMALLLLSIGTVAVVRRRKAVVNKAV